MRIIDEKGKLFGKINIIDFLIILFFLGLTPMFYFGYKIMAKEPVVVVVETSPPELEKKFIEIELDCRFIKLEPEVLKVISADDKQLDEKGQVIGEIIGLGEQSPYRYKFNIGLKEEIVKEDEILKQIKAKLKLKAELKNGELYYKDKLIKIGVPLEFKTSKYSLSAIPVKEEVEKILKVKFANLMPEIAKVVKIGDKQVKITEDNDEKLISKIVKVVSNKAIEFVNQQGKIITNPKYRDLVLEIEALCVRKPEGLFLKDSPVKIGKSFEFTTDLYSISGTIIGMRGK